MRRALPAAALLVLSGALLLAGCGGEEEQTHEFTDVRTFIAPRYDVPDDLTTAERFGMSRRQRGGPEFVWKTPDRWDELEAEGMRKGSWRVTGEPKTDCSLILLSGTTGGLVANVNRWRDEMGMEPLDEDGIATLPLRTLVGSSALYIDLIGPFSGGRGGAGAIEKARLLGYILPAGGAMLFLKFTGPEEVVTKEEKHFAELAASIDVKGAAGASGGATKAPPRIAKITWDVPAHWEVRPGSSARLVTLGPKDAAGTICYATRMGPGAGGLEANVNRWLREVGQEALGEAEIAALPTVEVLGKTGTILRAEGDFRGTGAPPTKGAVLFGMVLLHEDFTVFVKMVGPAAEMQGQYDLFLAFCKSLRETED